MKKFFKPTPVYIGKRKDFPDSLPNMLQEDNIIVFLAGDSINGMHPADWVDKFIHKTLRERTDRNKKGRFRLK